MTPAKKSGRDCYAIVAPGLEQLAALELRAIGIAPGEAQPGGVAFRADDAGIFEANLRLRTVSRVIVRVAEFRATAFHELERLSRGVNWELLVAPGSAVRLRVTCRKSRLYHSDGVAQRVGDAIKRRVKTVTITGAKGEADDDSEMEAPDLGAQFPVRLPGSVGGMRQHDQRKQGDRANHHGSRDERAVIFQGRC